MKKNFYVVKAGRTPGIYLDWDSCKAQTDGFPNARFRGFPTLEEAADYLNITVEEALLLPGISGHFQSMCTSAKNNATSVNKSADCIPQPDKGCAIAYVDGSYSAEYGKFSYGIVLFIHEIIGMNVEKNICGTSNINVTDVFSHAPGADGTDTANKTDNMYAADTICHTSGADGSGTANKTDNINAADEIKEIHMSKSFKNPELLEMRNVAGEITGAAQAMKTAAECGCKSIVIYHDYEGIAKWCTGQWKTNKPWTKKYRKFYDEISLKIHVKFVKVAAHTGDRYNELADELAKSALIHTPQG